MDSNRIGEFPRRFGRTFRKRNRNYDSLGFSENIHNYYEALLESYLSFTGGNDNSTGFDLRTSEDNSEDDEIGTFQESIEPRENDSDFSGHRGEGTQEDDTSFVDYGGDNLLFCIQGLKQVKSRVTVEDFIVLLLGIAENLRVSYSQLKVWCELIAVLLPAGSVKVQLADVLEFKKSLVARLGLEVQFVCSKCLQSVSGERVRCGRCQRSVGPGYQIDSVVKRLHCRMMDYVNSETPGFLCNTLGSRIHKELRSPDTRDFKIVLCIQSDGGGSSKTGGASLWPINLLFLSLEPTLRQTMENIVVASIILRHHRSPFEFEWILSQLFEKIDSELSNPRTVRTSCCGTVQFTVDVRLFAGDIPATQEFFKLNAP